jgi:hypothetical protein
MHDVPMSRWAHVLGVTVAGASVLLTGCSGTASGPTYKTISRGCTGMESGPPPATDVSINVGTLAQLTTPVRLHVGETLGLGGGLCGSVPYPAPESVRPVLEEIAHHPNNIYPDMLGDRDITYRATRPGVIKLVPGGSDPRWPERPAIAVTVLPAESPTQAARRGTGSITFAGGSSVPTGTDPISPVDCRRVLVNGVEEPASGTVSFPAQGREYTASIGTPGAGAYDMLSVGRVQEGNETWLSTATDPDRGRSYPSLVDGGRIGGPAHDRVSGRADGTVTVEWHC